MHRLEDLLFGPDAPRQGTAVIRSDEHTTWDDLRTMVHEQTETLDGLGVKAGQAVAVRLPDDVAVIAAWFATWQRKAVVVPLNPKATDVEVQRVLASVRPTAIVDPTGTASLGDGTGGAQRDGPTGTAPSDDLTRPEPDGGPALPAADRPAVLSPDTALVSFTSGTTGPPKPVPLAHARVLELMDGVLATIGRRPAGSTESEGPDKNAQPSEPVGSDDGPDGAQRRATNELPATTERPPMPNLIPVSLSLWAGIYNVLFAFRVGAPVVLLGPFTTGGFAAAVARHQVRSTVLPPAAMTMLAADDTITDLQPLRLVRSITAPLSPVGARRFRDRFGVTVLNGYGQTELGGEVIGWSAADGRTFGDTKLGAVGRAHPGIEIRVTDDHGHLLTHGEVGELEVRASARTPSGVDLADRLTPDGFLRTGDLARIDDDGFVWIEGRRSDMINRGGLKVFPAEVEEVLALHPDVGEAVVVGAPDERLGEVPVAYLTLAGATVASSDVLAAHCREHLAPYKVPVAFTVVADIPRNEVGKVQRHRLAPGDDETSRSTGERGAP